MLLSASKALGRYKSPGAPSEPKNVFETLESFKTGIQVIWIQKIWIYDD